MQEVWNCFALLTPNAPLERALPSATPTEENEDLTVSFQYTHERD